MQKALVGLVVMLSITLFVPCARPQSSATTVKGTVVDQSGAVIPGATVSLTRNNTGLTSKTTTNSAGYYIFPGLVAGQYQLGVEASGMMKFEGSLTAIAARTTVANVTMKIGKTTTVVSVHDVTPVVQTANATLGGTLTSQDLERLPLQTRNVMSFTQLIPGMEAGGRSFGIRNDSFEASLDGAALTDRLQYGAGVNTAKITQVQPGLDSIQELTVDNNVVSAKCSRPTCIVMTTKSGTNQIHGSAFEYNQNNAVGLARSRTDYYKSPPYMNQNQFGVTAGGPVYIPKVYNGKDKTFWFFSWAADRVENNATKSFYVPTAAMRNGDFSQLLHLPGAAVPTVLYDPYTTTGASNNYQRTAYGCSAGTPADASGACATDIITEKINPMAQKLFAATPLPTLPGVDPYEAPNWFGSVPNMKTDWTLSTRIDQRITDKDQVYGEYTQGNYFAGPNLSWPFIPLNSPYPANVDNNYETNWSTALHWTHTFSPTLYNELLVSGARESTNEYTGVPGIKYNSQLGLPNPFGFAGWPDINTGGLNGNYSFYGDNPNAWHSFYLVVDDNAAKIIGRNEFEFGFHFRPDRMNELPDQQFAAGMVDYNTKATSDYDPSTGGNFGSVPNSGDELANFYLGVGQYAAQLNHSYFYYRQKQYAAYFQDNLKAKPNLTLNMGLRWEYWSPMVEKNHTSIAFDIPSHQVILGNSLQNLYNLGATYPGIIDRIEGWQANAFESYQQAGWPQSLMEMPKDNFGPRLGFAYKFGHGAKSFVVRGGYSIEYFPIPLDLYGQRMRKNSPFTATFQESLTDPTYTPDGLPNYGIRVSPTAPGVYLAGVNSANAIPNDPQKSFGRGDPNFSFFALHSPTPMVQNWNFTLEKQILPHTLLRVGYVGNHSKNLEMLQDYNNGIPPYIWYMTRGTEYSYTVANDPYDQSWIGRLEQWQNTGWGNSNAIQVELDRRYSHGYGYRFFYVLDNNFAAGGQGEYWGGGNSFIPNTSQFLPSTMNDPYSNYTMPTDPHQYQSVLDYMRDTSIPKNRFTWDFNVNVPVGKGRHFLANSGGLLDKLVGGWQLGAIGSVHSNYFSIPSNMFPTGIPLQVYGKKYPIQNCTSGTCYPGYLWYNGYIDPSLINKPNGYEGIPANYKPAFEPLIPYGQTTLPPNAPQGTVVQAYWDTNTVWVPLNDGTTQRTSWTGMSPLRNQFGFSTWLWDMDASLGKNFHIRENLIFRLQGDFFNVFNHPGDTSSVSSTGILSTQGSANSPRSVQISGRLTW